MRKAIKRSLGVVALAAAYAVAARAGLALAVGNENVTAIWPPTGIAVAALVLFGRRMWPGVALGAVAANVSNGLSPLLASLVAVGNTLAPLLAAHLVERLGVRRTFDRVRDVLAFIALAPLTMTVSAIGGIAALLVGGELALADAGGTWLVWWVGDTMGVILLVPALLTLAEWRHRPASGRNGVEAIALLAAAAAATYVLWHGDLPVRYLVLPLCLFIALRLGPMGAAAVTAVVSGTAIFAVVQTSSFTLPADRILLLLHTLNLTVAVGSLALAALMTERDRAALELRSVTHDLESRVLERTSELTRIQDRFEEAQRLARIGSFHWDARTDTNAWTDQLFRIYGLEPGDPPGMERYLSFVRDDYRERVSASVRAAIESGERLEHEYPIVLDDGQERWVRANVEPLLAPDRSLLGLQGTCQDITDRKRAELASARTDDKMRALLASAPDAMVVVNLDGVIELVSDETSRMLGYDQSELIGKKVETLLPADLRAAHVGHRGDYASEPRRRPMGATNDLFALHKNGSMVPVDVSLSPVNTGDEILVSAALRDATARRRTETAMRTALERERDASANLRKLDAIKNEFLSAVSHELRTPLTAILGYSELLLEQESLVSDPTTASMMGRLRSSAVRLSDLLSDLLDLDRLSRGIVEPRRRLSSLHDLVGRALASLDVGQHPLRAEIEEVQVHVDPAQTERIIENLVNNAAKYTPAGTEIRVRCTGSAGGGVEIVVEDDGPGVPDDMRESIFDAFVRASTGKFTPGTGIGLTLVERFARLHTGSARVEDVPGGGSRFVVRLPGHDGDPSHRSAVA